MDEWFRNYERRNDAQVVSPDFLIDEDWRLGAE